jgi:hypothetical protein
VSEPVDDPEVTTQPHRVELEEAEVDVVPDSERPEPIEADPADVADQRAEVDLAGDDLDEDEF